MTARFPAPFPRMVRAFGFTFCLTFLLVQVIAEHEYPHPYQWRWAGKTAKFQNFTATYGPFVSAAASNWDSATNLTVSTVAGYSGLGVVNYYERDRGAGFDPAVTYAWSNGNACFDATGTRASGYCNTTDHRVNLAEVHLNTYYKSTIDARLATIMRHEPGHAFGLFHPTCDVVSVMRSGSRAQFSTSLTAHDVADINAMYP